MTPANQRALAYRRVVARTLGRVCSSATANHYSATGIDGSLHKAYDDPSNFSLPADQASLLNRLKGIR